MGMKHFSSSSHDRQNDAYGLGIGMSKSKLGQTVYVDRTQPNPDPNNYQVLCFSGIGKYLILKIKYLDCTNYEGKKILVFEDCTVEDLQKQKLIDPHFSESANFHSPIARFEPTEKGWENAIKFCSL